MYKAYDVGNIQLYHLCVQSNNSKATIICICLLNKIVSKQTMPSTTQYESMINHHSAHDSHSGVQELIRCPLRHLSPKILFMLPFRQRKVWRDRFPEISQNHAFNTIFLWCTYPKPNKISMSRWYEIPMLCWILSRSCTAMLATFVPWPQFRNAETVQGAKCVTRIGESTSSAWSFEFLLLKTFQINGFQVVPLGWNRGKKQGVQTGWYKYKC